MKSRSTEIGLATDPHANGKIVTAGPAIEHADGVIILVHGRGASAESILSLYDHLDAKTFAAIAPQAAGNTWYPYSFLAPIAANQPYLDSALNKLGSLVDDLLNRGVASEKIVLVGFSQGACLTTEFAARYPRRYGGIFAFTGGLIGPDGTPRDYPGSLAGTPVFLGTSDPDPHVPIERVIETQSVLQRMGASVELRSYPGMPHTINEEEIEACKKRLREIVKA